MSKTVLLPIKNKSTKLQNLSYEILKTLADTIWFGAKHLRIWNA